MKRPRDRRRSRISTHPLLLYVHLFFCSIPGVLSSKIVSLGSIEIFSTHEWLPTKPTVYFQCQGENKTTLPDVKKTHFVYSFNGEESWQPLTELPDKKCKRCGFYEKGTLKSDDEFDEWELCPGDFMDGKYLHSKDDEFNATLICLKCAASTGEDQIHMSKNETSGKSSNLVLVIMVSIFASILTVVCIVALYKYWQKRKREHDQARFLKLFEEGDDIEDELGLGNIL